MSGLAPERRPRSMMFEEIRRHSGDRSSQIAKRRPGDRMWWFIDGDFAPRPSGDARLPGRDEHSLE